MKNPESNCLELIHSRVDIFAMLTYCNCPSFPNTTVYCINYPTVATKVARYLGIIFSCWFVFSRGIFVVLIDITTAHSVHLTKGYCIQWGNDWGNCKPGGRGGMISLKRVCCMALQILTLFQTNKVHFPRLFSDPRGGELFKRWIALSIG